MPTGSADHAGETANSKLTFHSGHSMKADHLQESISTGGILRELAKSTSKRLV
jgi:hypothetical protein